MRVRVLTSLAIALLAAGCVGEEPAPAPPEPAATEIEQTAADPAPAAVAEGPDPPEPAAQPTVTAVAWDGSTSTAVCAFTPAAGDCRILQEGSRSWTEFDTLGLPGRPVRVAGTLSWEAATPATEQIHAFFFSLAREGPPVDVVQISGPSPLAFDVDLAALVDGGVGYALSLHSHHEFGTGDAGAIVEPGQPFHIELQFTTVS